MAGRAIWAMLTAAAIVTAVPSTAQKITTGMQQPLRDAGIRKTTVPDTLLLAQSAPYSSAHASSCAEIAAELRSLDAALGPDVDTPSQRKGGGAEIAAAASGMAVGALIPGFGLLKYVTGARAAEKRAQAAVYAGSVRRGYLKGLGLARRCPASARPLAAAVAERPELPAKK